MIGRAYQRFFRHIQIDEAWQTAVQEAAARGPVVYVLRNVSLIDYLALDYLTRKLELPRVGFANELPTWVQPGLRPSRRPPDARLRQTLKAGHSATLFLKRGPGVLAPIGSVHRSHNEGDELLLTAMALQRETDREIMMVPQIFVWTHRPEHLGASFSDLLFGPADFPGELRAASQFLLNYKNCLLRAGEALSLRDFLEQQGDDEDDHVLVRRLTYALLRKVERERRAIVGPATKPVDRIREEVLRSPKLRTVMRELGGDTPQEHAVLVDKARDMLRALETDPDAATLRALELTGDALVDRVYSGVDVDEEGIERLRHASSQGSVLLLPSHKSHVDYLLLNYMLRKHSLQMPVTAAGDNLSFFPIGPMFRRAGAFFIRRHFRGDRLYGAVVDAYIRRLLRDGWAIEFFIEGGRSRTGKVLHPKLGLLHMVIEAAESLEGHQLYFVPVSIGYERMMEEEEFAAEVSGAKKEKESARSLLSISEVLVQKYGRPNVQIGRIFSLQEVREQLELAPGKLSPAKQRAVTKRVAHLTMSEINLATLVTPGALVATALLCMGRRGIAHKDLVTHCARLTALLARQGARTSPSLTRPTGEMRSSAIRDAALVYVRGGLIKQHVPGDTLTGRARKRAKIYTGNDVIYTVPSERRMALDLPKNHIVHFFVDRALVSVALLRSPRSTSTRKELAESVLWLSKLFKFEFRFRVDAPFQGILDDTLADMASRGEIEMDGDRVRIGPGHDGLDGRGWVGFFASVVKNFLEGYRILARALRVLVKGPMRESELTALALRIGEQMFLGGEIERAEAVCQPLFENALAAFVDQGYVQREGDSVLLTETFSTEDAAQTIEARIVSSMWLHKGMSSW